MPKGTIRNPGTKKTYSDRSKSGQIYANELGRLNSPAGKQKSAKIANRWNENMRSHLNADAGGHANLSLRKSMKNVRSDKSAKRGTPTINKFRKDVKK